MRFEPKHVVTMVVAVCAAVVLAPVGVMAATGSLVNVTDPVNAARKAKVGSSGALYVESRAGAVDHSWRNVKQVGGVGTMRALYLEKAPYRAAVTEATFTLDADDPAAWARVRLWSRVQTSGDQPCEGGIGWAASETLKTVGLRAHETVQLAFDGPPLVLPPPRPGLKVCVGASIVEQSAPGTVLDVSVTGYRYLP